ncbi:MAG: hypothetical protein EOO62_36340, partial [Hymenobacter sp.]
TSGPSMNILIKLMSIVSLVIAPHIAHVSGAASMAPAPPRERAELRLPPVRFAQLTKVATKLVTFSATHVSPD